MKTFEYRIEPSGYTEKDILAHLNHLGKFGWRAVFPLSNYNVLLVREVSDEANEHDKYYQEHYLDFKIQDYRTEFSVRVFNCLKEAGIDTIRDLVRHRRTDMLKYRSFGKKSLCELDDWLEHKGLRWSMDV